MPEQDPEGRLRIFAVGTRVQAHPATDRWWRGDRYGVVAKVGRKVIHVKMDRSGKTVRFAPRDLLTIEE